MGMLTNNIIRAAGCTLQGQGKLYPYTEGNPDKLRDCFAGLAMTGIEAGPIDRRGYA